MTHYRSSNFFIIITSPNFQITTSFSQNPSLKLFILCSNFLFIFLNFFTCWIYSPIKEKWIQHFFLLQADPHTPQNASPPSQKIDWTFSQNKTFSKIPPPFFLKTLPKVSGSPSSLYYMLCWPFFFLQTPLHYFKINRLN